MYLNNYRFTMKFDSRATETNLHWIFSKFGVPKTFVEIGAYEGSTTFLVADRYAKVNPDLKIITIDPHQGSFDMIDKKDFLSGPDAQKNFLYNLDLCQHKNIEYINDFSTNGLRELINRKQTAEVIFIDGDHRADQVLTDLVMSSQLIRDHGIIICDDTYWQWEDSNKCKSAQMSPRMAVEFFIQCNWHKIQPISLPGIGQTAFLLHS